MEYYIYIYYYIYYNIYNNIYKSIGNIFGCKIDFRDGTMVRWYEIDFCGFSASRLESGSKITRIWEIEVRNLGDTLRQAQGPFPRQAISLFNIWNKLEISFLKVGKSGYFFVPLQCIWDAWQRNRKWRTWRPKVWHLTTESHRLYCRKSQAPKPTKNQNQHKPKPTKTKTNTKLKPKLKPKTKTKH